MPDDRSEMEAARLAGLAKRHVQRLENATYTAAEVKVLTEAALRLGRKEAGEEIAGALDAEQELLDSLPTDDAAVGEPSRLVVLARSSAFRDAAKIARDISSQPSPDATSGRTDPGMDSDLPQDSQAVRSPQGGEAVDLVGRLREAVEAARVRRLAERKGDPA